MTMPRVLSIDEDGFLRQNPAPEFETLRGEVRSMPAARLEAKPLPLGDSFAGDCMEIEAVFSPGEGGGGRHPRALRRWQGRGGDRLHSR